MKTGEMIDNSQSVPPFLGKLWKMVNDPKTDNLICWGKDGTTFIIRNEIDFLCVMLPMYYKHNKMSSFIRQLNMYGFRKTSIIESKEQDRAEFEFIHPFFRRGHPELLINVKRKGSTKYTNASEKDRKLDEDTKPNNEVKPDNVSPEKLKIEGIDLDDIKKVLLEAKGLHSRYTQVDSVINSLKQENAVLWREIAILRQKQQKQLQIVNKLIQFLMTVVQPSTRRGGGIGVKRRYPLMIHATPEKKQKIFSDGPTIHELDSSEVLADDLLQDTDAAQVQSPDISRTTETPQQDYNIQDAEIFDPDLLLKDSKNLEISKSEHLVDELLSDPDLNEEINENFSFSHDDVNYDNSEFLNSSSQDPLLANISGGCYNSNVLNDVCSTNSDGKQEPSTSKMTVAKCYPYSTVSQLNSMEDVRKHQDAMDNDLEQLKDFLSGCNSIDSKYLLNLFNDTPTFGLSTNQSKDDLGDICDLTSGSELTRYEPGTIDFTDLKDDGTDDDFVQPQYILSSPFNDHTNVDPLEIGDASDMFPTEN
ncbi:hypothetical protein RN001_011555 [Aquatica leii]|uniref:HSF-type DNA-binding domain-containing protein n=1 Tax=Aquatica leii TaxID=1421715 RepID=A0AAN7QDY2_9COLE|nr:hypothetical protein RN001_011555 [Aquatica leii]